MKVQVIAAAGEVIWGKKGELKGRAPGKHLLSRKQAEGQGGREQEGKAKAASVKQAGSAALNAALLASWCPINEVVVESLEPTLAIVQIIPAEDILEINAQPMMPPLVVKAELRNGSVNGQVSYSWRMTVNWRDRWNHEWPKSYFRVAKTENDEDLWEIDWDNFFVGGDQISLEAAADVAGKVVPAEAVKNRFKILGRNPSKEQAIAKLDTFQRVIMFKESEYRQFEAPVGGIGLPLVGRTSADYGIMQVNYSNRPTLDQLWNWSENKQKGLDLLNDAKKLALEWPGAIRSGNVARRYKVDISDACFRSCPNHFDTDEQILKEMYARYNGPSIRTHYWFWVPDDFKNPSVGGTWYKDNYGDSGSYADEGWGIFKSVRDGNAPPRW
jgi:hypothetical protein